MRLPSRVRAIALVLALAGAPLGHPSLAAAFPFSTHRWVWGTNEQGELGNNASVSIDKPQRNSSLPSGGSLTALSAGSNSPLLGSHSLALDRDRNLWAWGLNLNGQVGNGSAGASVFGPQQVCASGQAAPCTQFLGDVTTMSAGGLHSLAIDTFSNVWAWGSNVFGQLGSNVGTSTTPVRNNALFAQLHQIPGPPSVTAVAAGGEHSLALDSRGVVWAWGSSDNGQLGLGRTPSTVFALTVTFPETVVIKAIAAGRAHSLALDSAGFVWAWGNNHFGQLGLSSFDEIRNTPAKLIFFPPGTRLVAISAGSSHSLALDSAGNVWAWGLNAAGQLGNGQNIDQHSPTRATFPAGTPAITKISAGGGHNLALDAQHRVWAWGTNGEGQLGTQNRPAPSNVPVLANIPAGTHITSIAAGGFHSLAIETESFLFDLEAVLDLAPLATRALLLPQAPTSDVSLDVTTTSENLDPAGRKVLETSTVTDDAGHTLVLTYISRSRGSAAALEVGSVQYNDDAPIVLPRNSITTRWSTDAAGALRSLRQRVMLKEPDNKMRLSSRWDVSTGQTVIKVTLPTGRETFTEPGMVTVQVSTTNGLLRFSDGTHVWP
jgi:alpha-tubulin suppressor-like RCC1 family protein